MMRQTEVMRSARDSESHVITGTVLEPRELGLELCSSLAIVTTSTWRRGLVTFIITSDFISSDFDPQFNLLRSSNFEQIILTVLFTGDLNTFN